MSNTTLELAKLGDEIDNILNEFLQSNLDKRQVALEAGANVLKEALEQAAPVGTSSNHYKDCFIVVKQYNDHKYVGNTKTVEYPRGGKGKKSQPAPLSNILEYGDRPHIRSTFDAKENEIFKAIKNNL